MVKRIVLVSLLVVASAFLSVAGEHLDALPEKLEAVKEKGGSSHSEMSSMVAYNLEVIAGRLEEVQGDHIDASGILQGLNVMASVFDLYVGHEDITAHASYFRRVQTFAQNLLGGTYDVEAFAGALGQLLDAIINGDSAEAAFDAFFAYVLNDESVTLTEGVLAAEEDEEEVFEEDDGFANLMPRVRRLTLTVQPNTNSSTAEDGDPFAGFDDDDTSFVFTNARVDFVSR